MTGQRWRVLCALAWRRTRPFRAWLRGWQTLIAALIAFAAVCLSDRLNQWSAARLELHQCEELRKTLLTEAQLIQETLNTPASAASGAGSIPFKEQDITVPPLEKLLHAHEGEIGRLDPDARDAVLRLEIFYHVFRDTLHETPSLPHIGDTFVIRSAAMARGLDGIAEAAKRQADEAIGVLASSRGCRSLARAASRW